MIGIGVREDPDRSRERRLEEIFGPGLERYAGDDAVDPKDQADEQAADVDEPLRREVPPHHGG